MQDKKNLFFGVMSGTSLDGIDIVLIELSSKIINYINNIESNMLYYLLPDCNHILKSVNIKFKFKFSFGKIFVKFLTLSLSLSFSFSLLIFKFKFKLLLFLRL